MDRSNPMTLIDVTYTTDSIGQKVESESSRTVYCNLRSVSRAEWKDAGEMGFKPSLVATMFAYDFKGESMAEIDGKRYGVYRTYFSTNDTIELYLEEKAGVWIPATSSTQ